jgi:ATP-binding cassette, subfamily B (MDR/TAP), member 1
LNTIALAAMVASGTLLPLMDLVFGRFVTVFNKFAVGAMSPGEYRKEVNKYTLWFVYLFVAKFVLSYIWMTLVSVTATKTIKALRVDFVKQTLRQEIAFFDNPGTSIASQLTTNGSIIHQGISEKLGLIIQAVSCFVTAFVVAFAVNAKLTAIIFAVVPLNLIGTNIFVALDAKVEANVLSIFSAAHAVADEAFSSIRTVHAFGARPKLGRKFEGILDRACKEGMKKSPIYAGLFSIEYFCVYSAFALAFWQGIRMWSKGEVANPGDVVTVMFAVIVATQALTIIAPQAIAVSKAVAAATEVFRIMDRESRMDSLSETGARPDNAAGRIDLESVDFAYPSRPAVKVLKGLTLSMPARKTTALVGASGSGKSSIVNLIERWYECSSGSIKLDGMDIKDLNVRWLRESVRLVEQEPTLFSGTVYDNVARGLAGTRLGSLPDDEKRTLIEEACRSAFAHDFIMQLPRGYHTLIGERGATLSGGQKQRIVIARSIVSDPLILMLDEATSALDPQAEKIVQKALDNVGRHRTMVVIAHRLSTIRSADNIVVMADGVILEQGPHLQLFEKGGAYARLVQAQDLGAGSGDDEGNTAQDHGRDALTLVSPAMSRLSREPTTHDARGETGPSVADSDVQGKGAQPVSLLKSILRIAYEQRSQWVSMLVTAVACILGGLANVAIAILFAEANQAFELTDTAERIKRGDFFSLMFFVVSLGLFFVYAIVGWAANIYAQHLMRFYKLELFHTTMRQKMTFFDDPRNTTGSLVSRLSSEPTNLQDLLSANIAIILISVVNLGSCCILAVVVGWKLGLVLVFGALPFLVLSGYVRIRLDFKLEDQTSDMFARSSGLASEAVRAIRTVSSLTLEKFVLKQYEEALAGIEKKSLASVGKIMFWYALSQSISFLAMALGFWYGGRLISTGEYTTRQFYIVFVAVVFSGENAAMFFMYTTSKLALALLSNTYRHTPRRHHQGQGFGQLHLQPEETPGARRRRRHGPPRRPRRPAPRRVRPRRLRLRASSPRPRSPRRHAPDGGGKIHRARGSLGLRQDDHGLLAPALLRPHGRPHPRRQPGHPGHGPAQVPLRHGHCPPGTRALHRVHPRKRLARHRAGRADRRGSRRRPAPGQHPRLCPVPARGAGHAHWLPRRAAVGRPEAEALPGEGPDP